MSINGFTVTKWGRYPRGNYTIAVVTCLIRWPETSETVTVTRDGKPVAELRPLIGPGLSAQALLDRWKNVPAIDGNALRADIAKVLDLDL